MISSNMLELKGSGLDRVKRGIYVTVFSRSVQKIPDFEHTCVRERSFITERGGVGEF